MLHWQFNSGRKQSKLLLRHTRHVAMVVVIVLTFCRLVFKLALDRPDLVLRLLPGINMHHPSEDMRHKGSACGLARFTRRDRTVEPEFWMLAQHRNRLSS